MKKIFSGIIIQVFFLIIFCNVFSNEKKADNFSKLKISGLFDMRAVITQKTTNWSGCPDATGMDCTTTPQGATRYGGNGNKGKVFFDLSQLTLDIDADITKKISLHNQVNIDAQVDGPSKFGGSSINLIESYLKISNFSGNNSNLRLGIFTPLFSRENGGLHWTTQYTITPSAINTWIATIIRVYGVEATTSIKNSGLDLTLSLFSGADEGNPNGPGAGKDLVAHGGWLMHDYWMPISAVTSTLDNKIGFYGKLKYQHPNNIFDVDIGYYDNNADVMSTETQDIWNTKFYNLGTKLDIGGNLRLLGQYLQGITTDYKEEVYDEVWKCEFKSYYLMGIYVFRPQGIFFTVRYDKFNLNRVVPSYVLRNDGSAWTFTIGKQLSNKQAFTLEYLQMKDKIRSKIKGDVPDNLWQFSYKVPF